MAARPLAMDRMGTRVVQQALEKVQGDGKMAWLRELSPHTQALFDSPHGNFVLTKAVEVMPSTLLGDFIAKVLEMGPLVVARHKFACRFLERLVEHCSERELRVVLDELVADADNLCTHQYGNFVVQTILEHGSLERKQAVLDKVLTKDLSYLAMHRRASHVVQKVLECSDKVGQNKVIQVLLEADTPTSLVEVACNFYGAFVLMTVAGLRPPPDKVGEVKSVLAECKSELGGSLNGLRVAEKYGLEVEAHGDLDVP